YCGCRPDRCCRWAIRSAPNWSRWHPTPGSVPTSSTWCCADVGGPDPIFAPQMGAIGYYIALPFIHGIARLPFPLLYLLSDGLFVLVYRVFGYRREVVLTNLRNSFPERSEQEIRQIAM